MEQIYLDNAATTPVRAQIVDKMIPYLYHSEWMNPSAAYGRAKHVAKAVERARCQVAKAIGATSDQIYFTSGGAQSDTWAIMGSISKYGINHIAVSSIEHHAIMNCCKYLQARGITVDYIPVGRDGVVSLQAVEQALKSGAKLVSVMTVNNETGVIQPINDIGKLTAKYCALFHTDAVQAIGNIPVNVEDMGVDMLSMSGHKFGAPCGIGALYIRNRKIDPIIFGGSQEQGIRGGTHNVAGIVAIGAAIELASKEMNKHTHDMKVLRSAFLGEIMGVDGIKINCCDEHQADNIISVTVDGVQGLSMLMQLDLYGVEASTGSACSVSNFEPSHVLTAMGLDYQQASNTIRFSLGFINTKEQVIKAAKIFAKQIGYMRQIVLELGQ